ncbi:dehydratase [Nocardioides sp. MAH-18]|uniref:Dehydratase n=1 Tax=Nocardioides agri TaxID=2682843 RepID=A0A6L6XLY1_9ACTN|nr:MULTISPECIES: MaoC/PaaZ C-terminal domain-containing protein [unclassified Nocardioides]MBA2953221.1 dehydratase [Nocardioides sp. CGMCC 1.13656]MVQ48090.1 dehydratase [Nocardioides sp. MAH-18]
MIAADLAPGAVLSLECPTITRTALALYAGASGDHNPVHIDIDACRAVGIDDVFAHGMLSMAYLGRLLTDSFPQQSVRSFEVRFTAITPVNASPTCHATVTDVEDGHAHLDLSVQLPDGTETLRGRAVVSLP